MVAGIAAAAVVVYAGGGGLSTSPGSRSCPSRARSSPSASRRGSADPGSSPHSWAAPSSAASVGVAAETSPPHRADGSRACSGHLRRVRSRAPRPSARRPHLADRTVRGAEPDDRSHAPGRDLDAGYRSPAADRRIPRLVRAARRRVDRVRATRPRGARARARAAHPRDGVRDGRPLRGRPRSDGCRSRRPGTPTGWRPVRPRATWSRAARRRFGGGCRASEDRLDGGRAADRRPRAAPRRLRDRRARHRAAPRLPAARPDLDRGAASAPRPLEPARAVRRHRARPPALGGAEADRMERVPLASRGSAAAARAHASEAPGAHRLGANGQRVPARARELEALRPARARAQRPDALACAARHTRHDATRSIRGGARGTSRSCSRS